MLRKATGAATGEKFWLSRAADVTLKEQCKLLAPFSGRAKKSAR